MRFRTIVSLSGLMLMLYAAQPLFGGSWTLDVCCTDAADCPDNMLCGRDTTPCSSEAEGYCVSRN